jgi:hypothetical protein
VIVFLRTGLDGESAVEGEAGGHATDDHRFQVIIEMLAAELREQNRVTFM